MPFMAIGPVYRSFIEVARERGVDVARVLGEAGLTESALLDPGTRVSPELGRAIGGALFRAANLPTMGLEAARRLRLGDLDVFGYLLKHADNLWSMLQVASQYSRLLGDTASVEVASLTDSVEVSLGRSGGRKLLHEGSDFAAGVFVLSARALFGEDVSPREVRLPCARPRDERPYQQFFGCPLSFDAECVTLVYASALLHLPSRHADPQLSGILRRQADQSVSKVPQDAAVPTRVRAYVAEHLDQGDAGLAVIAAKLAMSERTLRRRLREAGTGYRALVDDVRRERALMLADQGLHTATEIAVMVGFEDSTAFARAFRRWTGSVPRDYMEERRRNLADVRKSEVDAPSLRAARLH
jgi:AraC-like DNA-binding protein